MQKSIEGVSKILPEKVWSVAMSNSWEVQCGFTPDKDFALQNSALLHFTEKQINEKLLFKENMFCVKVLIP